MRSLLIALALSAVVFTIACGGGDDKPETSLSPVGTKSGAPTATPEVTENTGVAPDPSEPTLDQELTEITSGEAHADIGPGETQTFDPETLATDAGATPACDSFQYDFTWQVQDPFPPDGVDLQWTIERNGAPIKIAQGPAGEQSVGCDIVTAVNNGPDAIHVAVKYKIGSR